ncbi:DNA-3-methyladenine glycosidase [Mycena venus]|uniref:DNA-3-methyladenine glycosidase n=1 Tax=Mycena venus TaxID=2733690 RepID=A0A8H6YQ58_9AGAR|nr:DNA-3-methyladenine glycosidase [Mycena venus]
MPATRSSTRSVSATSTPTLKRKLESAETLNSPKKAKPTAIPKPDIPVTSGTTSEPDFVPADAVLTFSFEDAKEHLINADHRFEDVFAKLECTPFQKLETVHPFRALASSILGQQISVLAARSIQHKFIRLYDPSIPEKYADYNPGVSGSFFPTPQQVVETDIPTLRTAGLSARKAEYNLQTVVCRQKRLIEADDEELAEMLIEVRGIGRWTVDMFAIFSLRRPDILPVGDLGVQRGVVRWFLSQHSPSHSFAAISPEKELIASPSKKKAKKSKAEDDDALPVFGSSSAATEEAPSTPPPAEDASAMVPLPPTFTPSIKRTLAKAAQDDGVPSLPEGLTVAELKSRLDGKKKIKGAFLSPTHMEQLTASWRPYRSLGVYYMWALADASLL